MDPCTDFETFTKKEKGLTYLNKVEIDFLIHDVKSHKFIH